MVTVMKHCNNPNIHSDLLLTRLEKRDGEVGGSQARSLHGKHKIRKKYIKKTLPSYIIKVEKTKLNTSK